MTSSLISSLDSFMFLLLFFCSSEVWRVGFEEISGQACAISLTIGLFAWDLVHPSGEISSRSWVWQVAIYAILRSRGLRVVLSASLFVAFLVATQLSVKIVESKPFNFRPNSFKACHDSWWKLAPSSGQIQESSCGCLQVPWFADHLAFFLRCGGCLCVSWSFCKKWQDVFNSYVLGHKWHFALQNSMLQRTLLHLIRSMSHHKQGIGYGWESHARSFLGPFRYCDGWRAWLADTHHHFCMLRKTTFVLQRQESCWRWQPVIFQGPSYQLQLVSPFQRHDSN